MRLEWSPARVLENTVRILNLHELFQSTEPGVRIPQDWLLMRDETCEDWDAMSRALWYLRDQLGAPLECAGADWPGQRQWWYRPEAQKAYELPGMWRDVWALYWRNLMPVGVERVETLYPGRQPPVSMVSSGLHGELGGDVFLMRVLRIHRCMPWPPDRAPVELLGLIAMCLYQGWPLRFEDPADAGSDAAPLQVGGGRARRRQGHERVVSIHALNYHRGHWILDVQDHHGGSTALQAVSLERVLAPQVLEHAEALAPDPVAFFAHQDARYGAVAAPKDGRTGALLRFTAASARWGADEVWHPDQHLHFLPSGDVLLRIPDTAQAPLVRDALEHGLDVGVLEPTALRKEIERAFNARGKAARERRKGEREAGKKPKSR